MGKIKFDNIGRAKQHEVTLFELYESPFKLSDQAAPQSFAERRLTHYAMNAKEYLKLKGFDDTTGYFDVINGKIERVEYVCLSLFAAIEKRDKTYGGQTGEYLAALIDHKCRMLPWPPINLQCSAILDIAMEIQELYFRLFILDKVHPKYSAGESRTDEANASRNFKAQFGVEAESIYREIRQEIPHKSHCYSKVAIRLKENHPGKKTPQKETIKSWFKSRKDLP